MDSISGQLGLHSYDLGVTSSGLFWTHAVPADAIDINLGAGTASLHLENVPLLDAFTVANSLNPSHPLGAPVSALISLDVEWGGATTKVPIDTPTAGFRGLFVEDSATAAITASTPSQDFVFVSDPGTSVNTIAEVAHEQNGIFAA